MNADESLLFFLQASVYFDYLIANKFQFDGLTIDQKSLIQLSSITVNNSKSNFIDFIVVFS
jgi:hypothetical protein